MRTLCVSVISVALLAGSAIGVAGQDADEPTTTDEMLSGMVTEEVEQSVLRVVNDGVRDLSRTVNGMLHDLGGSIVAGMDGHVWLFQRESSFRLGEEAHSVDRGWLPFEYDADIEVGPDGTVWALASGPSESTDLRSFDGRDWSVRVDPAGGSVIGVEVQPDGTVWAAWLDPSGGSDPEVTVGRLDDDWVSIGSVKVEMHDDGLLDSPSTLAVSGDGEAWLSESGRLYRHDGSDWQEQRTPTRVGSIDVGPDGTLWLQASDACWGTEGFTLARFDGTDWAEWNTDDGIPAVGPASFDWGCLEGLHQVAPDGSLWVAPARSKEDQLLGALYMFEELGRECGGVASFDATTWNRYLEDLCIVDMDIALDGSVWLLASEIVDPAPIEAHLIDLYVIRPEAVAAIPAQPEASVSPKAAMASPIPMPELGDMDLAPTFFEGEADWTACCGGCMTIAEAFFCSDQFRGNMEMSDPRLDGQVAVDAHARTGAVRIENERGAWSGALSVDGEDVAGVRGASRFGAWLLGEEAYEGLNAFMYATLMSAQEDPRRQRWVIDGWVFDEVPWPEAVPEG